MTDDTLTPSRPDSGDAPVRALPGEEPVLIEPTATLRAAAAALRDAGTGLIVVGEPTSVEDVVSERNIARAVAAGVDPDTVTVSDVETTELFRATEQSTVAALVEEMTEDYVRHILVGDANGLVGIVSMRDLIAAYLD